MEYSESNERGARPEFNRQDPGQIFTYARDKARYLRYIVSERDRPAAIDHLADELEEHARGMFETLPSVTVVSDDVYYMKEMKSEGLGQSVVIEPLPFTGDAEVLKMHTIIGHLYGFHQGERGDIRAYISGNEGIRKTMGGIYIPLLSVGVETSDIKLTETVIENELERIGQEIKRLIKGHDKDVVNEVLEVLGQANDTLISTTKKLHNLSPVMASIGRRPETSAQLIDTLLEYIKYRLKLSMPHIINATAYREVITKRPTPAYVPHKEPKQFFDVITELGLIGESANRSLGLLFINDDKAVQIPVQYITSMYHKEQP